MTWLHTFPSQAWLALLLTIAAATTGATDPHPAPTLGPDEVVRTQLEALRANDALDRGIEICFRFASPRNRAMTGPLQRFGKMIKEGPYALMLTYETAQFEPVEVVERLARQRVTLTGATRIVTYVFYLSRQTQAPCKDCWMTDSVLVERIVEAT